MLSDNVTIIICCAGMGTRLGIGTTKALVKIKGKSIIERQLELMNDYDDVRVVVGYQAEKVIEVVKNYRKDVMFVLNYDYKSTGPAGSVSKALVAPKEYVVIVDGDMLVHPNDLKKLINYPYEVIGIVDVNSDVPVYVKVNDQGQVYSFNLEQGDAEWSGIAKLKSDRLIKRTDHIFDMIEPLLPINALRIRAREVDTPDDFDRMIEWVNNGQID